MQLLPLTRLFPLLVSILLAFVLPSSTHAQSAVSYTALTNDQPVFGSLAASSAAYYSFAVLGVSSPQQQQQTVLLGVSALTGSPSLYVSLLDSPPPSSVSCNWSASWQTGNVLTLPQPPPYTAHVAVVASPYSSSNYTLTVTAYDPAVKQSTPIPLYGAQPTSSAIAAGEYRYYTYNISSNSTAATIALTETYGQSWLLLNSPNTTALPTVSAAQYRSTSATFPLVALQRPAAGVWTIGVWCNASSAFTIVAVSPQQSVSMELGITYPGYLPAAQLASYSVYLDPLLLATAAVGYLDFELSTLSGDADLYCNCTVATFPSACRWSAVATVAVEHLVIPAGRLQAGTLQCVVHGYLDSSYTLSVSLGSSSVLSSGEPFAAQAAPGSSRTYSMVFPAPSVQGYVSGQVITVSVLADAGATVLYIGGYGAVPGPTNYRVTTSAATEQLQILTSDVLCVSYVPGSSPPLCELQVTVFAPNATTYRIVASTSGQLTSLTAGLPMEAAVSSNQTAYLSFSILSDLSNLTLLVTVTDGSSGLVLQVGSTGWNGIDLLWNVTQQPGSNVLVFQLDATNPLLPSSGLQGSYAALLSTTSGTAIVSVVYTLSTVDSDIIELLDGVPQAAVVDVTRYSFYYFSPPPATWPYAVTITVDWQDARWGSLGVGTTNGPQVVTLGSSSLLYTSSFQVIISPQMYRACNPTINSTCGYSIFVRSSYATGAYTVTVTTGKWVTTFYANDIVPAHSGVLAVNDVDYWQTSYYASGNAVNPQLLIAVTMLSGSATLWGSNVSSPNATSAQQTQSNVSSVGILAMPLLTGQTGSLSYQSLYLTVACTSIDSTPCEYTLKSQYYYARSLPYTTNTVYGVPSEPVSLVLPAGGMYWVLYSIQSLRSVAYFIIEATATIGTPSLYASCVSNAPWNNSALLPSETAFTWSAVSSPLVIEVTNYTVDNVACPFPAYLVIGVLASGGQATMVDVIFATPGVAQDLTYNGLANGLITPTFPVSYYNYNLWNNDLSVVLVFKLLNASSTCSLSQLRMVVSDTVPYPDPADPSTYNYSRTAVPLPNGAVDFSIGVTNYSKPAGGLRAGPYYVAVTSSAVNATCKHQVQGWSYQQSRLLLNRLVGVSLVPGAPSYFTSTPMPYNTSASFAFMFYGTFADVLLYVGINSTPSPADPSSYVLATTLSFNSTQPGSTLANYVPPVYVPASACSSATQAGQACNVLFLATWTSPNMWTQTLYTQAMSAGAVLPLQENQAYMPSITSIAAITFQFNLPASPVSVVVSVNTSSAVALFCSYQYVNPSSSWYDWQTSSRPMLAPTNTTMLNFTWNPQQQMQLNPGTPLAAMATTCYCTVQTTGYSPYSVAYATAPLNAPPAPSSSSSSSSSFTSSSSPSSSSTSSPAVSSSPSTSSSSFSSASSSVSSSLSSSSSSSVTSTPATSAPASSIPPNPTSTPASSSSSSFISSSASSFSSSSSSPSSSIPVTPSSSLAASSTSSSSTLPPVLSSSSFVSASSSTAAPSNSSHSGLSSGALAAAVVVPVVAVLGLVAVLLLCLCRRNGAATKKNNKPSSEHESRLDETDSNGVSMMELSVTKPSDGRLVQQYGQSDSA